MSLADKDINNRLASPSRSHCFQLYALTHTPYTNKSSGSSKDIFLHKKKHQSCEMTDDEDVDYYENFTERYNLNYNA